MFQICKYSHFIIEIYDPGVEKLFTLTTYALEDKKVNHISK